MRIALVVAAAILLAGCSASEQSKLAASAASGFHEKLDAGQFDSIYDASSDELKNATTRQDFDALLDAVHRKLGSTQSVQQTGWNVNYNMKGTFVTLAYGTKYSEGNAQEQFLYRLDGGRALLVRYNITSNTLITK
jgi:hypothetical protein